jgi:pimeloyl-ACP methyl ester carboxylesterase
MKRFIRFTGLFSLVLLTGLWCGVLPAPAGSPIDLSQMNLDEATDLLGKGFDSKDFGSHGDRGYGRFHRYRRPRDFDPNAFEFLLNLAFEKVAADPDAGLPEFYQVDGLIFPEIKFQLRLPTKKQWNKKFYMVGCGGFCGGVDIFPVTQFTNNLNWGLVRGYASATTDSGHTNVVDGVSQGRTYAAWAEDNRRGEIDWAYRSIHEVTRVCKALVHLFYQRPARLAYFAGCSTGGRMAIMEALRYPKDFDGIISGAPALEYTGLVATWMSWIGQAVGYNINTGETDVPFTTEQILAVQQAVLYQCDDLDGVVDGLITDPRRCPAVDFSGLDLPEEQMGALDQMYRKPVNYLGAPLYQGVMPYGSEFYWPIWVPGVAGTPDSPAPLGLIGPFNGNFLKYMAFQNDAPGYSALDFDFDATPALLKFMGKMYNATSADLENYRKLGGKIIMYHGWADSIVPPIRSIAYYEAAAAAVGSLEKTQDFFRLFLVPGMDHCSTAQGLGAYGVKSVGLDNFDMLEALDKWVEKGIAPDEVLASGKTLSGEERSRPLFPYPLYAKYIGGDFNDPDSFMPENDGSVRWNRFRKDTFYSMYLRDGDKNDPLAEGEGLGYFYPYGRGLDLGTYSWRVWSPSMFEGKDYAGYYGDFVVEAPY